MSADDRSISDLLASLCDETISSAEMQQLDGLLCRNAVARRRYLEYLDLHARLSFAGSKLNAKLDAPSETVDSPTDESPITANATADAPFVPPSSGIADCGDSPTAVPPIVIEPLASSAFPLSSLFSGWPLAYLVAIVVVGVGLLVSAVIHVSSPIQLADPSSPIPSSRSPQSETTVARVTAMVDCVWDREGLGIRDWGLEAVESGERRVESGQKPSNHPSLSTIHYPLSTVSLGDTLALKSGLLELTYDTGARVILQGPVTYKVDSVAGGYLSVGKLTAKLEKRGVGRGTGDGEAISRPSSSGHQPLATNHYPLSTAPNPQSLIPNPSLSPVPCPLFSIKTPTALVTDLGTEFGVWVTRDGVSEVHVLTGVVELQRTDEKSDKSVARLEAGQAGRVDASKTGSHESIPLDRAKFDRPLAMLAARSAGRPHVVLFHDDFDAFEPGRRWTPIVEGGPEILTPSVVDGGRGVLRMCIPSGDPVRRGIATAEPISLDGIAALQVEVRFQPRGTFGYPLEVRVLGASRGLRMYLQPHTPRRVGVGRVLPDQSVGPGDRHSDNGVYQEGQWCRFLFEIDRRGVTASLQDDVNLASLYRLKLTDVNLTDLGSRAKIELHQLGCADGDSECLIDSVMVRGERGELVPQRTKSRPSKQ